MRLDDWLKAFPHTIHLCGFSPTKENNLIIQRVKVKFIEQIEIKPF
jgi:hypothetical protein